MISIDGFGVSDTINEISVNLDFGSHNSIWKSVKVQKMSFVICGSFESYYNVLMLFSFSDLKAAHEYKNVCLKMKLRKNIWLPITWSNPYNF